MQNLLLTPKSFMSVVHIPEKYNSNKKAFHRKLFYFCLKNPIFITHRGGKPLFCQVIFLLFGLFSNNLTNNQ